MNTCAMLITRPGQKFLGTCGKPATAVIGKLEVCEEHRRERSKPASRSKKGSARITKFGDLE
jgi:hypothetical protein